MKISGSAPGLERPAIYENFAKIVRPVFEILRFEVKIFNGQSH